MRSWNSFKGPLSGTGVGFSIYLGTSSPINHAGLTPRHIDISCMVIFEGVRCPERYIVMLDLAQPNFSARSMLLIPPIASWSLSGENMVSDMVDTPSVAHIVAHIVKKIKKNIHKVIDKNILVW